MSDKMHTTIDKHSLLDIGESWPHYREGSLLEDAALQASSHVQVAYEMALSSALGAMSAACQGLVDVAFPNGYTVPTSLMLLILAESGDRKTALDTLLTKPISDFQRLKSDENNEARLKYERDLKIWKIKEKELQKLLSSKFMEECKDEVTEDAHEHKDSSCAIEKKLHQLDKERPTPPTNYKLIYQNTTPSALAFSMHENIPLAFLLSDEAGALLNGPALRDLYLFNSLWSGTDILVDRRTSESFALTNARLTASIMVQPTILKRFMKKRGDEAHDSGFFARFLVVQPKSQIGERTTISPPVKAEHLEKFHKRILERIKQSIDMIKDGKKKTVLKFTATAQKRWESIYKSIEIECRKDHIYTHAQGHASKLMDNISRVAAIIHTFENEDFNSDIEEHNLEYAYKLINHYSSDYMKHVAGTPEIVINTNQLVRDIRNHGAGVGLATNTTTTFTFTRSTIKQYGHYNLRNNETLLNSLELLRRLGHVKIDRGGIHYRFNEVISIKDCSAPELKNGELYYIEELPKFSDQEIKNGNYRMKNSYSFDPDS